LNSLNDWNKGLKTWNIRVIIYEARDRIGWVTFNRPESMNAMNRQMTGELIEACREIEEDVNVRLAIFTGAGEKAFSAGMDLKERAETVFSPIERRQQKLTNKIYTQARAVAAITKPTIAAIRGYCVGADWNSRWPVIFAWRRMTPN
jgi:enoyl-CoA hydratase/carnithine racemase